MHLKPVRKLLGSIIIYIFSLDRKKYSLEKLKKLFPISNSTENIGDIYWNCFLGANPNQYAF
jgi:hypothetical protein